MDSLVAITDERFRSGCSGPAGKSGVPRVGAGGHMLAPSGGWRHLYDDEVAVLIAGGNHCTDWDSLWVCRDGFSPDRLRNCRFAGIVRLGRMSHKWLEFGSLHLPVGISESFIVNCDIGDDCAIHNVGILGNQVVLDNCLLFNIGQMTVSGDATFGCAVSSRGSIAIMNESGRRFVLPFNGMNTADAYLWGKYRDDVQLQERLADMTCRCNAGLSGRFGEVGGKSVVKNATLLENVSLGEACVIDGASKLRNVTVNSSAESPSLVGENAVLEDGIVGFGCRLYEGCTARSFVLGSNCTLKSGVRFYDSILGDNGTIACCEVISSLIFPSHEQHHNNSFLIAAVVAGQSNIAAGATLGSNHNSRMSDGELVAGRGFWPGLCVSLKHSSRFAAFTLLSKGNYPSELDVRLPFSLVSNNETEGVLEVMPAYWWMYDMYALARNGVKYRARDARVVKAQNIEFDSYAPDCMEEVMRARELLELWTGIAVRCTGGETLENVPEAQLRREGAALLRQGPAAMGGIEVLGQGIERSSRKVRILKPAEAYAAYADMIVHYAVKGILPYLDSSGSVSLEMLSLLACGQREREWVNLGGQIVRGCDVDELRCDIAEGRLPDWNAVHSRYDSLFARYPDDRLSHSLQCLAELEGWSGNVGKAEWLHVFREEERICRQICDRVYGSRKKDFDNPYRQATFRSPEEMAAVSGTAADDAFIARTADDTAAMLSAIDRLKALAE